MKALIVAIGRNNEMGQNGALPWGHAMPADLAHFKTITSGKTVIMGRKTYESIGRPLPNRQNIVVTSHDINDGCIEIARNLDEAFTLAENDSFVIGGARLYEESLSKIDLMYITEIDAEFLDADTYFPSYSASDWNKVSRHQYKSDAKNAYNYDFLALARKAS